MKRSISLNLSTLPRVCGKCGGRKSIVQVPGRVQVFCPKCDKA